MLAFFLALIKPAKLDMIATKQTNMVKQERGCHYERESEIGKSQYETGETGIYHIRREHCGNEGRAGTAGGFV